MILFLDTETTGKWQRNLHFDHPEQPRIVQIAAILANETATINELSFVVYPDFEIPTESTAIHGISTEHARNYGIPLKTCLSAIHHMAKAAEFVVAHNAEFDRNVLLAAFASIGRGFEHDFYCTMKAATPVTRLPSIHRSGEFKWPKLSECMRFFFDENLNDAHDAMADVRAAMRVWRELERRGIARAKV